MRQARLIGLLDGVWPALILWLAPSSAHAYCRQVNVDTPQDYDPAESGCFEPQGAEYVYWSNLCVGYSLQKDASPKYATLEQATRLAAQAFQAWSSVKCPGGGSPSITASNNGPADCTAVQYNDYQPNQHVIVFRDDAWPHADTSNTLGKTNLRVGLETGRIFDADIEINSSDYVLAVDRAPQEGEFDLASIMTHEVGHFLGLAHSANKDAVMATKYHIGSTVPTQDDVDGICKIYPPDGTRNTSSGFVAGEACDAAPENGFGAGCGDPDAGPPAMTMDATHPGCSCRMTSRPLDGRGWLGAAGILAAATSLLVIRRRSSRS
jgi:hypothetical protein